MRPRRLGCVQPNTTLARSQGHKTPDGWAQRVWNILNAQGQKLVMHNLDN